MYVDCLEVNKFGAFYVCMLNKKNRKSDEVNKFGAFYICTYICSKNRNSDEVDFLQMNKFGAFYVCSTKTPKK
jgi:hypothetical protein